MIGIDTSAIIAYEIAEHADHGRIRQSMGDAVRGGERLAVCGIVLAEFVHVAMDARRFRQPLSMHVALERAKWWVETPDVDWLNVSADAVLKMISWMNTHQLGRKRVIDTLTAAVFLGGGVDTIMTLNPTDFRSFGHFQFLP